MLRQKLADALKFREEFSAVLKKLQIKRKGHLLFTKACMRRWQLSQLFWCFRMLKKNAARSRGATRLLRFISVFQTPLFKGDGNILHAFFSLWKREYCRVRNVCRGCVGTSNRVLADFLRVRACH